MNHELENTVALLGRTPATLDALLRGLPEMWTHRNEGAGTFTVFDVIGHLIYADKFDWLPRARMILDHGETRPFEPFDRWGHVEECRGRTLPQLLDEFARVRARCLKDLRALNLTPSRFISGANTKLVNPTDVAVDSTGAIYVVDAGTGPNTSMLLVFSPTANGNVAPTTAIALPAGSATGLALSP